LKKGGEFGLKSGTCDRVSILKKAPFLLDCWPQSLLQGVQEAWWTSTQEVVIITSMEEDACHTLLREIAVT
jgi:sugar/nucleoside kinase (ribokinase family)